MIAQRPRDQGIELLSRPLDGGGGATTENGTQGDEESQAEEQCTGRAGDEGNRHVDTGRSQVVAAVVSDDDDGDRGGARAEPCCCTALGVGCVARQGHALVEGTGARSRLFDVHASGAHCGEGSGTSAGDGNRDPFAGGKGFVTEGDRDRAAGRVVNRNADEIGCYIAGGVRYGRTSEQCNTRERERGTKFSNQGGSRWWQWCGSPPGEP